jgi:hypothetical protein
MRTLTGRTSTPRRPGALLGVTTVLALGLSALLGSSVAPAGAAVKNACKLFQRAEVQEVLGASVSGGRIGPGTSSSAQCEYQVAAASGRPLGTVVVLLRTKGGAKAFAALRERTSTQPVVGLADAVYSPTHRAVSVLRGDVMLAVQGNFLPTAVPLEFSNVEAPLAGLAALGMGRLAT